MRTAKSRQDRVTLHGFDILIVGIKFFRISPPSSPCARDKIFKV